MSTGLLRRADVTVLFARSDSCYFDLVADVYDIQRDARTYSGEYPVVAHPPCRGWGRLRHLAKPRLDEKALALFAVDQVRRCGGVLEHPHGSSLWPVVGLPFPGMPADRFGGFTLLVDQGWWGHAAPKPTYLYIVGCARADVGDLPVQLHRAAGRTLLLSPADRERTPLNFALFLLGLAAKCRPVQLHPAIESSVVLSPVGSYSDRGLSKGAAKRAAFRAWSGAS